MAEVEVKYCNGALRADRDAVDSFDENEDDDCDFSNSDDDIDNHTTTSESINNGFRHNRAVNDCVVVNDENAATADYYENFAQENHAELLQSVDKETSIVGILGKDKYQAEARLAARRQARAEAREIRMRELERQQKEQEENADKAYDMHAEPLLRAGARGGVGRLLSPIALQSSRRSSEDSLEDSKDVRFEFKELEEKFRKTMILNAQLDNDKSALTYQLDVIKDKLEELQEQHAQLQRSNREKCSALEISRREATAARLDAERGLAALTARDFAATEAGLVLVALPPDENNPQARLAYLTKESEKILEDAGEGSLDVRLQKINSEKHALEEEVKNLRLQLNSEHSRKRHKSRQSDGINGPSTEDGSASDSDEGGGGKDARRLASEYLYRACRAEQEAAALGAATARLEAQVTRHKAAAERAEQAEDELKAERRRLQREAREALSRVEELETENSHLTKRLDKLKNAKSALLKDL